MNAKNAIWISTAQRKITKTMVIIFVNIHVAYKTMCCSLTTYLGQEFILFYYNFAYGDNKIPHTAYNVFFDHLHMH